MKMKVRIIYLFPVLVLSLLLNSCTSSQKVAYLQTLPAGSDTTHVQGPFANLYEARIKPKDLLSITVVTSAPEASRIYNLLVPQIMDPSSSSSASSSLLTSTPTMQTYLVDNDGNIDFPMLGKISAGGHTRKELEAELQERLDPLFSKEHPIITIRITNYAVNVLGEVARPGKYASTNDRLTIFEGLALAGDMTLYGKRDNVKVLRESADGNKTIININLNDKNIIHSPAYYLEQNDVVYVEPNKARSRASGIGTAETLSVSALSILVSLTSLIVTILK
jgi:polysaccharide export outer membrane protein